MQYIYLDHAATTPTEEHVLKQMFPYFQKHFGNASSNYKLGRQSFTAISDAREQIAQTLNAKAEEIIFTSGGTEADNLAVMGAAQACCNHGKHIVATQIEHPAVKHTFEYLEKLGFEATYVPVSESGQVSPAAVAAVLRPDTVLVSVMFANNELGTIQPIEEIAQIVHSHGALFHTDAVQAFCSTPIDVSRMGIDLLSLSGHKIYGPKGIGALYVRNGVTLHPLLHGGMQEAGQRAGTENVPAIVGLGYAAKLMYDDMHTRMAALSALRDYFEHRILHEISGVRVNGMASDRLPGHSNLTFIGVRSRQLINILSDFQIYASTGSACNCLTNMHSYVLRAIGLTDSEIEGTIRFSLGKENTVSDMDQVVHVLKNAVLECRRAN